MSKPYRWLALLMLVVTVSGTAKTTDPFTRLMKKTHVPREELHWYPLRYVRGQDIATWMMKHPGAIGLPVGQTKARATKIDHSQCGADLLGRRVWLRAPKDQQVHFQNVLKVLDQPSPQILVEARIVRVNQDAQCALGIRWGTHPSVHATDQYGLHMNLPQLNSSDKALAVHIAHLPGNQTLDLELSALEEMGVGEIIAMPHLVVTSGQEALIESGLRIPYQHQTDRRMTAVHFEKAVLSLSVIAQPLPSNQLAIDLTIHQDKPDMPSGNSAPSISTQVLQTHVVVPDSQVIVLGGIYEYQCHQQQQSIPGVGRLPLVGRLFRHNTQQCNRSELLVFLQPSLIDINAKKY